MKTPRKQTAENYIKEIRRKSRRIFSSEQKIQIVMEALRAEMSIAELCRKYSIGKTSQIDHPIPVQIDHQFRSKLTTTFQFKLTT